MRELPALGPNRKLKLPKQAEQTLDNGLTVIAIRRSAVPLVELRLRVPFGRAPLARAMLLSQTLFSGTSTMSTTDIAAGLQTVGGALDAGHDPDRLLISGNALVTGLDRMLEILAGVLTDATYPTDEVATEREVLVDHLQVAQQQPAHLVRVALLKRMYGRHPYAVQTPEPGQVKGVRPGQLRALHADRVRPDGATLVIVGDLPPERAIEAAAKALDGWTGLARDAVVPPVPPLETGPLVLVDRPGSVQSSLRIALPGLPRQHPDHAALQLANLVFGGYFSSRWTENIREDKGYTYGPHSGIEHSVAGSALIASAEVATEVTGPALLETRYELGRLASLPVEAEELEQARRYALGSLQLGISTQAGLATHAAEYAGYGLRLDYLAEHAAKLAAATREDVFTAAQQYLAPARAVTVVLGDAAAVEGQLAALTEVQRA
ncbi:M16 family metallopeptidase [Spirilliplanes yamanashiensis]|uniref:Peptidase M16 n=1 Tax=Spirilliplanes yamanashiensis TaxID=42233 RepID=A0A8J4DFY0_9ACTN|nr:pitrilysin family protein [Spirilliplanes yamanashiensis]MDP9820178.1 putative Zn-dependent peptidase [Spirilliplanes yamanashiensis]GIJ01002.1 peptidase M16 [Spirilliplanes yamanashiensis]